jgi:glycosyltransferase involved in cell wall biosynthesis
MRVAYVTSFYPPERIAGAELGTEFMALDRLRRGDEVHVVVTRPHQAKYRLENRDGVLIHWMPYLNVAGLRLPSEILCALFLLLRLKPDIVHGNCLLPGGAISGLWGKLTGKSSLVLCYGYDVTDMKGWVAKLGRLSLGWVKRVLVATRYCATVVEKHRPDLDLQVYYAGCDERVFRRPELRPHSKASLVFDDERQGGCATLLFIGRMIPEKGLDFLLSLMVDLPSGVRLKVVGGGADRPKYEAMVRDLGLLERVDFLGVLPNGKLPEVFATVDAFVLPSHREPFGVVCIEAILSGVPVLCSDVMGLPEAVTHEKNGLVVSGREPKVWLAALERILADVELRDECWSQAELMRSKWSWQSRLDELDEVYGDCLAKYDGRSK